MNSRVCVGFFFIFNIIDFKMYPDIWRHFFMLKWVLKMHKLYKNTIPKQVMFGVFYAIVVLKYLQIKKFKYNSLEFFFTFVCQSTYMLGV